MPQLKYDYILDNKGAAGQPYGKDYFTRNTYNASGDVIPFGAGVVLTGTGNSAELPSATGQTFGGVAIWTGLYEDALDSNSEYGYADKKYFERIYRGSVIVEVDSAVAVGDAAFVRHTANGAGKLIVGKFGNSADSGTADAISGVFLSAAAAGETAVLALNLI